MLNVKINALEPVPSLTKIPDQFNSFEELIAFLKSFVAQNILSVFTDLLAKGLLGDLFELTNFFKLAGGLDLTQYQTVLPCLGTLDLPYKALLLQSYDVLVDLSKLSSSRQNNQKYVANCIKLLQLPKSSFSPPFQLDSIVEIDDSVITHPYFVSAITILATALSSTPIYAVINALSKIDKNLYSDSAYFDAVLEASDHGGLGIVPFKFMEMQISKELLTAINFRDLQLVLTCSPQEQIELASILLAMNPVIFKHQRFKEACVELVGERLLPNYVRFSRVKQLSELNPLFYLNPGYFQEMMKFGTLSPDNILLLQVRPEHLDYADRINLISPILQATTSIGLASNLSILEKIYDHAELRIFLEALYEKELCDFSLIFKAPWFFESAPPLKDLRQWIDQHSLNISLQACINIFFSTPVLKMRNRVLELFSHQLPYNPPTDISPLLQQIMSGTRLGRHTNFAESASTFRLASGERYLIEVQDAFSPGQNLGSILKQNFNGDAALYRYAVYQDKSQPLKGIIIDYYGGHDHTLNCPANTRIGNNMYMEHGYLMIRFLTRDNWQTIDQSNQFEAGSELLQDTIAALLIFANNVKASYPNIPMFYKGDSFGACKGAFINILLSNRGRLREIFAHQMNETAGFFESILKKIPPFLFEGFILHDGNYIILKQILKDDFGYYVNTPQLILTNFDDDRVTIDNSLDLFMHLNKGRSTPMIHFFVSPQGALGYTQVPDGTFCSADGHASPALLKYHKEYQARVLSFLAKPKGIENSKMSLSQYRHAHTQILFNAGEEARTILYRLYHANLHAEPKPSTTTPHAPNPDRCLLQRLQKAFSEYAHMLWLQNKNQSVALIYETLIEKQGIWMISTLLMKKNSMWTYIRAATQYSFLSENSASKIVEKNQANLTENLQRASSSQEIYYQFYLTEHARKCVNRRPNPLEIISRAREYAYFINARVIKFFAKPQQITITLMKALWDFDIGSLPTHLQVVIDSDLSKVSRAMSLAREYTKLSIEEQNSLFSIALKWSPIDFLYCLRGEDLSLADMGYLMSRLVQDESPHHLLRLVKRIPKNENFKVLVDWIAQIKPADRNKVVGNYIIVCKKLEEIEGRGRIMAQLRMGNDLYGIDLRHDLYLFEERVQGLVEASQSSHFDLDCIDQSNGVARWTCNDYSSS